MLSCGACVGGGFGSVRRVLFRVVVVGIIIQWIITVISCVGSYHEEERRRLVLSMDVTWSFSLWDGVTRRASRRFALLVGRFR